MREISYSDALREALQEEMSRDSEVLLIGEDIGTYGGAFGVTRGLLDRFGPDRVVETPISEGGFVGMAVGASLLGARPVVEIMFMDFMTLVVDPLVNQAAKLRYVYGEQAACPLVVRTPSGGGRSYGPTHSQVFEAWFAHIPGLKVVAPSTPADAKGLMKAAIRDNNPVLFVEHKMLYPTRGPVPGRGSRPIPIGKARIARRGTDVTIIAWSWLALEAEAAADALAIDGIDAEVIDMRTLSPLDMETVIESVQRTGRLVIADEAPRSGGVSADIGVRVFEQVFDYLDGPIRRVTTPDVPVPASPVLEQAALPNRERIAAAAAELCGAY